MSASPRALPALAACALASALAREARADAPPAPPAGAPPLALPRTRSARFSWVRSEGAERCPDERSVARAVALRLGRRPFSEGASQSVEAVVSRDADAVFTARIYLRNNRGVMLGERVLHSDPGDCASLAGPAALAVALAIDPEASLRPHPTSVDEASLAASEPSACPPAPAPAPVAPAPAPAARVHVDDAELRAAVTVGLLPRAAAGAALSAAALAYGRFSLRVGAQWFPEARTSDLRFGFGLLSLRLAACGRPAAFDRLTLDLCGGLHAGALHAVVYAPSPTTPGDRAWGALEASTRASVRVAGPVWAVLTLELTVPFVRHAFLVEGSPEIVFQQPPAAFLGGVGLALSFW